MAAASTPAPEGLTGKEPAWTIREQWILLGIFLLALALRLLHLLEIQANDPFFTIPAVDGRLYHAQAQALQSTSARMS